MPPRPKPDSKLRQLIAAFLEEDDFDDVIDEAMSDDESDKASELDEEEKLQQKQGGGHVNDCPLSFSSRAVRHRLPKALVRINAERAERAAAIAAAAAEEERLRQEAQRRAAQAAARQQAEAHTAQIESAVSQSVMAQQDASLLHAPLLAMLHETGRGLERFVNAISGNSCADLQPSSYAATQRPPKPPSQRMAALPPAPALSGANSTRRVRPPRPLPVDRVWATVLALEVLKEFDSTWLLEDDAPEPWRTVVDGAAEYLRAQAKQDKQLYKLFKSGVLSEAADKARTDWKRIQAANVLAVRNADVINKFTLLTHLQRSSARIVRSVMTDHGTFATFLDTEGYIMRWQRLMILVTLVLSTLLTSIWFYYSRGANCCLEIRTILNCDPVGECMGYNGNCGDLQDQFSTVQGPYIYGTPPEEHMYLDEYVCTAFPDDAYITDQMLVGLISVAVALPVDLFLARAFELANEGNAPESWLEAPAGKWKWVVGKNGHNDWRLADPKVPISDLVLWLVRYGEEPIYAIVFRLIAWLRRKLRAKLYGPEPEAEEAEEEGGDDASAASREARADAITKRLYASLGLLGVYMCWTIFAWFIFTYGMLIYKTLGDSAQQQFAKVRTAYSAARLLLRSLTSSRFAASRTDLGHWLRCVRDVSCRYQLTLTHARASCVQAWTMPPSGRRCSKPRPRQRWSWLCWTSFASAKTLRGSRSMSTSCRCRRCCSTAPPSRGGSRRGSWCACRRASWRTEGAQTRKHTPNMTNIHLFKQRCTDARGTSWGVHF